jgi:hypothetical protein
MVSRLGNRPRKMHKLTVNKGGKRQSYGGLTKKHPYTNGDLVEYKSKIKYCIGVISASDLYQICPTRFRLKKDVRIDNTRLIKRNCNLLVYHIKTNTN